MTSAVAAALARVSLEDSAADLPSRQESEPNHQGTTILRGAKQPFRFFDLPSEIRLRIYSLVLFTPRRSRALCTNGSVGASSKNKPLAPVSHRISLLLVSRRVHDEASYLLYSGQTFRLFPIQDYSRLPTVRALSPRYRACLHTIELILGSSWTAPPRSWAVNKGLGLDDMAHVRTLKVFIQCDPSHPVFEGFRVSQGFYTGFAGELVAKILSKLPSLVQVEFDGYPSVQKHGALMSRLIDEVRKARKKVLWGPERGWTDQDEDGDDDKDGLEDSHSIDVQIENVRHHAVDIHRTARLQESIS